MKSRKSLSSGGMRWLESIRVDGYTTHTPTASLWTIALVNLSKTGSALVGKMTVRMTTMRNAYGTNWSLLAS